MLRVKAGQPLHHIAPGGLIDMKFHQQTQFSLSVGTVGFEPTLTRVQGGDVDQATPRPVVPQAVLGGRGECKGKIDFPKFLASVCKCYRSRNTSC